MSAQAENQLAAPGPSGLTHRVRRGSGPGPHPTVVMLHGRSGDETLMWVFARALPPGWLALAPRAPLAEEQGGHSWLLRDPGGDWPAVGVFEPAVAALQTFIGALPALYGADPRRVYLMGFSQGAAVAFASLFLRPGLARGLASLVGFVPSADDPGWAALRGLPVFMAVGRRDERIPLAVAQAGAAGLRAAGLDVDYHEYDAGHKLDLQGGRDLAAWWRAQAAAE